MGCGMEDLIDPMTLPSGLQAGVIEVLQDANGPNGLVMRFRFLVPDLKPDAYDVVAADMMHLCQTYALPRLPTMGPVPGQIIISFADQNLPFGQAAPEAVQYFEAFRIENGECVWEIY